jgi:hypothetical protein
MPSEYIPAAIRRVMVARAKGRCEYCACPEAFATQRFAAEHIVPRVAGGQTVLENLAWSCIGCNGHKHVKQQAVDPETQDQTALFNPRSQRWNDHFAWSSDGTMIVGLTTCGRATIVALQLNRSGVVNLRRLLVETGRHPPADE